MKILLALDGSPSSDAALVEMLRRPWPENSEVKVVSVAYALPTFHDPMFLGASRQPQAIEEERQRATTTVAAAARKIAAEAPELRVSTAVFDGSPKEILLDEAARFGADLVIAGSHGRGATERFLLGSVSQALALHAPCSVEIVRPKRLAKAVAA